MSLSFIFGSSGAGKSRFIYDEVLSRADKEADRNFLIVVPDQFTMQTQKDLVLLSPGKCIMNIDVLSFSRLTHRIFEECGADRRPVLDDTGKSLILRKLSGELAPKLRILGRNLSKQGYIHEVKSSISEFMQYGIGKDEMEKLLSCTKGRGSLYYKLNDLGIIYDEFLRYIEGSFITKEETLDLVCEKVEKSELIKDSVMVFDGFTGFTPVQYRLLRKCLKLASKVYVTLTIPGNREKDNPYKLLGVEDLFYLSRKTVADLSLICEEERIVQDDDIYLDGPSQRTDKASLLHLEENLFRLPLNKMNVKEEDESIKVLECRNPEEEALRVAKEIRSLVREKGYQYRDISVILGDLESYAPYISEQFAMLDIPVYIDRTAHIVLNPFIEFIKSGISVIVKNFTYDTVFHYLRSGMAPLSREETDELENYCIRFGIKGKKAYSNAFTKMTKDMSKDPEGFDRINGLRVKLMDSLEPLQRMAQTAGEHADNLYEFILKAESAEKLSAYEDGFKTLGENEKASEYSQIYTKVMELIEQIVALLKDEEMSLKEFGQILEAGFDEIKIGTIPQGVDKVFVGDNKRSRLKEVKALFFMGVNDDFIPSKGASNGVISDFDRDYLKDSGVELSPGPREQMYIQRYYLYLNLTKPSDRLIMSYSKTGEDGKSRKPAYLIGTVTGMFEGLHVIKGNTDEMGEIGSPSEGLLTLSKGLRHVAEGMDDETLIAKICSLLKVYKELGRFDKDINELITAAFKTYNYTPLTKAVAKALYGDIITGSVTRMEEFASCQYRHFLKHGLTINERDDYDFAPRDIGNVAHSVLEDFGKKLSEAKISWFDFDRETGERIVDDCINDISVTYNETILYSSARNQYFIERLRRIMKRTVFNLQTQLRKGSFHPERAEASFREEGLMGRIDRFDICEDADRILVKIIDYKTGDKKFELSSLYYGLQMQLAVYLDAAMKFERKAHPDKEIVPAAMLYYNVKDPIVECNDEKTAEEIQAEIEKQLKMTGVVNSEKDVIRKIDGEFENKSTIIPVEYIKGGAFGRYSSVYSEEEILEISDYVNKKIKETGDKILAGEIKLDPYMYRDMDACKYCDYKGVCGFDCNIPGFEKRKLDKLEDAEAMELIKKECEDGI
ncbi:MAG: exodeoxyribonuclease V subunit gamma [Lachnospiraceae bacterium]|nr:exodeoxyribonuclease V subunit gamma [Lachnospiraceae bacterium]